MKALTVQQPWASLIAAGIKDVENRTWSTKHRGDLIIHAGTKWDATGEARALVAGFTAAEYEKGVLICAVELVDVVRDSDSPWADTGCFHWILRNPRPMPPAAFRGRLGLWDTAGPKPPPPPQLAFAV